MRPSAKQEPLNEPVELAKALLVEPVPHVDEAVGAAGGECVVHAVEGHGIDGVDLLHACKGTAPTYRGPN